MMTRQRFHLGNDSWEAEAAPTTPVYLAGGPMYTISSIGGVIQPYGDQHIKGNMGGAWAHPLRVLHGWSLALDTVEGITPLDHADVCDLYGSHITRHYAVAGLQLSWTEYVVEGRPALASIITVRNCGTVAWDGALLVQAELDLRGCWFGGWNATLPLTHADGSLLTVTGDGLPFAGRASAISVMPDATWSVAKNLATARILLTLAPGQERQITLGLGVAHTGSVGAAGELAWNVCTHAEALLAEKIARYAALLGEMVLETPDPAINQAWLLARLNFYALAAEYPDLPPYFLAGLPEYPQLFGCDNEYSTPGAAAAGFGPLMRSTLTALATYGERACGKIPHEITTNGRVFHPGNTQETPQFAAACWEYTRWTGDLAFLAQVYPLCVEGLEHFSWILEFTGYPIGDGVVERLGMGEHKLDGVCYLYQALVSLREAALALGKPTDAAQFDEQATRLRERFEQDWWLEEEGLYADSLHLDKRPQLDGHWTVVLPFQLRIASAERSARGMARIEQEWVNQWGLVHTRGSEPHVWTLPTGLLALAAFERGRSDLGLKLIRNIAITAHHGTLGTLKELIPQGICFIQLWSAGLLVQGLLEGLLGLYPAAHLHQLTIRPQLPTDWPEVALRGLRIGTHTIDLRVTQSSLNVTHRSGMQAMSIAYRGQETLVQVGETITIP
jgi:hypothetical protein